MSEKISGVLDTGSTYGKIHFEVHDAEYGASISVGGFFISGFEPGLTLDQARQAVQAFCIGYDLGVRSVCKPDPALKQIALHQYESKDKEEQG